MLSGHGVVRVLRSENSKFKQGDHIYGWFNFEKYSVYQDVSSFKLIQNPYNLPWSHFVSACGMPGRTAYYGYRLLTDSTSLKPAKPGETIYISTAAGPVGSILVQLFQKHGLKVVASAGANDKVAYVKELGADVAFNYKICDINKVLKMEGPLDIYWDHVGGGTLEAAVANMNRQGRIVICGTTSGYNSSTPPVFRSIGTVLSKSITIYGFMNYDFDQIYGDDFEKIIPPLVAKGEIQCKELIVDGLKNGETAIVDVLKGTNFGKTVISVVD